MNIPTEVLKEQEYIYKDDLFRKTNHKEVSGSSLLIEIIKNIKIGADVTQIAVPTFTLAPLSTLENITDYCTPDTILKISDEHDPLMRMVLFVQWLLEGYVLQIPKSGFYHYKPYNPILGEVFHCKWEHEDSTTVYVAEQVSHHPPISAYYWENKKKNLSHEGTAKMNVKFYGNSVEMIMIGECKLNVFNFDEVYNVTFPNILARGIIFGSPSLERSGIQVFECKKTGFKAKVEYKKGMDVEGEIKDSYGTCHVKIEGNLQTQLVYTFLTRKREKIIQSAKTIKHTKKTVEPVFEQQSNESRRVWHKVTFGIFKDDLISAGKFKHEIEEYQRKLRRERAKTNFVFEPQYFKKTDKMIDDVPIYKYIHAMIGEQKQQEEEEELIELD